MGSEFIVVIVLVVKPQTAIGNRQLEIGHVRSSQL